MTRRKHAYHLLRSKGIDFTKQYIYKISQDSFQRSANRNVLKRVNSNCNNYPSANRKYVIFTNIRHANEIAMEGSDGEKRCQ